jgi:hypothetical protein
MLKRHLLFLCKKLVDPKKNLQNENFSKPVLFYSENIAFISLLLYFHHALFLISTF